MLKLFENPKTPSIKVAAMYVLSTSAFRFSWSRLADYDTRIAVVSRTPPIRLYRHARSK